MQITLTAIKADTGSVGGHIGLRRKLLKRVREYIKQHTKGILIDFEVSHIGGDTAIHLDIVILCSF